jgi:hypothetical protein
MRKIKVLLATLLAIQLITLLTYSVLLWEVW